MNSPKSNSISSVYGPVRSWRVGQSLGIDLICATSVCSFNCVYCQLGSIQRITDQRQLFVSTDQVLSDFEACDWNQADIITYSGSGEPTLAVNLGDVSRRISRLTQIPQLVLTNGTLLHDPQVIDDLKEMDRVYVKLDAASEEVFQRVNRPVAGITLESIVKNIQKFRKQYSGHLGIQVMFLPVNLSETDHLADLFNTIQPDEIQLNTPTRPYPKSWNSASRGGHAKEQRPYEAVPLRTITREDAASIEQRLREKTGLKIQSIYQTHIL